MGFPAVVWSTQKVGAATNGAVAPVESFRTSPFEMFSTRTVNVVVPAGAPWAIAIPAKASAATDSGTARMSDMRPPLRTRG
jgi:hypothetical protein